MLLSTPIPVLSLDEDSAHFISLSAYSFNMSMSYHFNYNSFVYYIHTNLPPELLNIH